MRFARSCADVPDLTTVAAVRPLATSYHLLARLAHAVPPGVRYPVVQAGGAAWFHASRAQHRNALQNYGVVLGLPPGDPAVRRLATRAFENYGQMLADFVLLGSLGPDELLERVSVRGLEHVDRALEGGRGCVLVTPHMGSWDSAGSVAAALGYPISAVVERFPGSLNDAVVGTREAFGMRVIQVGRSAVREVRQALEANGLVALPCDLPQGPGGVEVRFFDHKALVPGGPAAFARRLGSTILPLYSYRVGPGRYQVDVSPQLEVVRGGDERAGEARIMQEILSLFETFIRPRPDQWYAFRPMFAS